MQEPGERVGALLSSDPETKVVKFLGYGVYEGDFPVGDEAGGLAQAIRETGGSTGKMLNPRIRLDNGDVVWGCECWWGSEEAFKTKLKTYEDNGWEIRTVKMQEERDAQEG